MSARGERLPFLTKRKRQRQIVDRGAFSAVVGAFAAIKQSFLSHWFISSHLFKTASKFIAALATSIHDANSSARNSMSGRLSPTETRFTAEASSCAYAAWNFTRAFS